MEQQIKEEFLKELQALLKKYNAELEAKDYYEGYPECGEDVRMTVTIPSIYNENILVRPYVEIDLGSYLN